MKCPKCDGKMAEGFIGDATTDLSVITKQNWGTGLQIFGSWGLTDKKEIKTYCCEKCGYLESYASPQTTD
ncbi:MAG: PF20097 family protein [Patescibacteria group bacterium]